MQNTIRIIFRLIALISLVVAGVWYYNDPSFRSLLALLGALPAILEMMVSSRGGNTSLEDVKSEEGGASLESKTGGDITVKGMTVKGDIKITNE